MWDLSAKSLGVPIYQLFGGPFRTEVPAYANGWYFGAETTEAYAERALETVRQGFRALKWDPFLLSDTVITREDEAFALGCVAAVREAVGPEVSLLIEAHGRFNPTTALRLIRKLEPFDITWFEEPVPPDLPSGLTAVAKASPIPIAAGERFYTRYDFLEPLRSGSLHYAQPDVLHTGGLAETRKIAALAEAVGVQVCPHNAAGPVGTAATLQLAASIPNFGIARVFLPRRALARRSVHPSYRGDRRTRPNPQYARARLGTRPRGRRGAPLPPDGLTVLLRRLNPYPFSAGGDVSVEATYSRFHRNGANKRSPSLKGLRGRTRQAAKLWH